MQHGDYIVFVDESGDHSLESINEDYPVFVLAFCVVQRNDYVLRITPAVRELKMELFGHDLVVLHEHSIRKKTGAFSKLSRTSRDHLIAQLTRIISDVPMTVIAVVIDKVRHKAKYLTPFHPYHLAMQFGLERIVNFLRINGQEDKTTMVIFEARGKKEDSELELHFRRVSDDLVAKGTNTALDIVIADKRTNSEGLQLADLIARPIGLHVIRPQQPNRAWTILEPKPFKGSQGATIFGNGLKIFPT